MAGIQAAGLGSGLDINSLVNQLIGAQSGPLNALSSKAQTVQNNISNIGSLKSAYSTFQSALQGLSNSSAATALMGLQASSSDAAIASATIASGGVANAGAYAVNATTLASAQSLVSSAGQSSASTAIGGGTLSISLGAISGGTLDPDTGKYSGSTFEMASASPVNVTIPAGSSLTQIASAINSSSAGVKAAVVFDGSKHLLTLSSAQTGAKSAIKITSTGDAALSALVDQDPAGPQNFKQINPPKDLAATINGIPVTGSSNTLTGNVEGLNFTFAKTGPATVTVSQSASSVASAMGAMVSSWNALNALSKKLTGYDAETKVAGPLQGDSLASGALSQLRSSFFGSSFSGANPAYSTLMSLGVSVDSKGVASIDNAKLSAALKADPQAAQKLFASGGGNATKQATDLLTSLTGAAGFQSRIDGLNSQLRLISKQQTDVQARLESEKKSLLAQFTSLDTMVSSFNNVSSFLSQQFG